MDDDTLAAAVLQRALDAKPARLTVDEMTRELFGERSSTEQREAVARVVGGDLAKVALLHFQGEEFIEPTRAAIRYSELTDR